MGFTTIVMVFVIVWAVGQIFKDTGLSDRIRNGNSDKDKEE